MAQRHISLSLLGRRSLFLSRLSEEKASLQESLSIAEGEETNTREAYRTLKMDYDKKLKKLAPARKIRKKTKS
jgi:hypothetical protein